MMHTTPADYETRLLHDIEDPTAIDAQLMASLQGAHIMNQEVATVGGMYHNSLGDFDEDEGSVDSFNQTAYEEAVALWAQLQGSVLIWVLLSILELGSVFLFGVGPAIMGLAAGGVYMRARKHFGVSTKALICFYLGCAAVLLDLWSIILDLPALLGIITCHSSKGGSNFVCRVLQNRTYVYGFVGVILVHALVSAHVTYRVRKITQMLHPPAPPPPTSRLGSRISARKAVDGRSYSLRD